MKISAMHITPIALGDPPLLNAAGLHAQQRRNSLERLLRSIRRGLDDCHQFAL